jgi:hypothetical protein
LEQAERIVADRIRGEIKGYPQSHTLFSVPFPHPLMIIYRVEHRLGGHARVWHDDAPVPAHPPIFALPFDAKPEVLRKLLRQRDARRRYRTPEQA